MSTMAIHKRFNKETVGKEREKEIEGDITLKGSKMSFSQEQQMLERLREGIEKGKGSDSSKRSSVRTTHQYIYIYLKTDSREKKEFAPSSSSSWP